MPGVMPMQPSPRAETVGPVEPRRRASMLSAPGTPARASRRTRPPPRGGPRSDPCAGGAWPRGRGTRAGQRQPRPRRGARERGDGRLGHLVQAPGGLAVAQALAMDAGVEAQPVLGGGGHGLHVAARAERPAGAGQDDAADVVGELDLGEHARQRAEHRLRERVAALGAVHGEHGDAVLDARQEVVGAGVDVLVGRGRGAVREASGDWRAQLRAGIRAYLETLVAEPVFTRAYLLEIHAAGPAALESRAEALRRFAERYHASFEQAHAADPALREPPPDALLVLCAGTEQLLAERAREGRLDGLGELEDVFCFCAEAVLLGPPTTSPED